MQQLKNMKPDINPKKNFKLPPVHLRLLLIIIFMIITVVPTLAQKAVLMGTFMQSAVEARRIELKSNGLILANKISKNLYLDAEENEKNESVENEIDNFASIYDGRIVITNSDFRIIKDTFNLAEGKLNVAEEIIKCFEGESSNNYNSEKRFIIQTFPIYSLTEEDKIEGVMLITASTESLANILKDTRSKTIALFSAAIPVFLVLSIVIANIIVRPFVNLGNSLAKISAGDLYDKVNENTYTITREISSTINSTLSKLKAVDQSREDFVANVSHELKTPITSMRVLADSIMSMEEAPVDLYKEFMNDISNEVDRESKIIDDLLALVKLDKSATKLNIEQTDINLLIKQTLKRLKPIAALRKIDIILETAREVKAEVDETKLSLALNNLVENAIKYNKEGGWVRVTLDADHKFFYIKVIDSGVGIAEEFRETIFERFYRIDKARSRETGGTGLGLSITKSIIMRHKGMIKVSGKEGEGSVFTVRIPLNYIK